MLAWGAKPGRAYVETMPEFSWQDEDEGRIRVLTFAAEKRMVELFVSHGRIDIAAFVIVAIDTGCRRGELVSAQPEQLQSDWLRLWGDKRRTGNSRSVPLTPRSQALLERYLPWRIEEHTLPWFWNRARKDMGLEKDKDFVLHACRHTCATRLVEKGVNLRVVQQYMGHRSIQTTLRSAHVSDTTLRDAAAKLARAQFKLIQGALVGSPEAHPDLYPVSVPVGEEVTGHPHPTHQAEDAGE